ncbi:MAG TPA: hypothetical protein VJB57_17755 [Dehalococcoidia bacterium]|nr:hypothetical protein [Dehalococcoidia bacterium]
MTTTYRVGLTIRNGSVDGWVFDLPGCRAVGGSREEVLGLLPVVIADHLAWLNQHGEQAGDASSCDLKVIEEVTSTSEFVFEDDKKPVTSEDIEAAVRHVGFAHADLKALTSVLPDTVLDWRVPPSAVKIDNIFPDVRSMRDMVDHVGAAMSFHIRGVGDVATRVRSPEGQPNLQTAFETTVARIRALNDEERAGTVYRITGPRGESEWTARKSLRRILNHQRFHTREVQQRLAWLTLGVPEILPVSRE